MSTQTQRRAPWLAPFVLLVAGGILGLVWVRRDGANATVPVESDPG